MLQFNEYKVTVEQHFDNIAPFYDKSADWRGDKRILSWFERVLSQSKRCLDIGTGTGQIGGNLFRHGIRVIGLDRSKIMLHEARHRLGLVTCADVEELPFPDSTFDSVTLRQVLHYVDDQKCLQEIGRILKNEGLFACAQIAAPDDELALWWTEIKRIVQPLRQKFYTEQELIELIVATGFSIEKVKILKLRRRDPWQRFLINCTSHEKYTVKDLLRKAPPTIAKKIRLELSKSGVAYTQSWLLLLARRAIYA